MNDETITVQEQEPQQPDTEKGSFKMDLYFWMQALAVALVLLILTFTLAGRVIQVVGSSMVPTLHEDDLMLLQSVGYTPRQGDVVVLRKASFMHVPIVKRVIATGGQHVSIDYAAGTVTVDGLVLDEPYILEYMNDPSLRNHAMSISDVTVPEGSIFVMGDNRNNSSDSRDENLGTVDTRYVL
ncbi:MAG: signal peptidase I, partial [Oscillospiraceae bacterium]|nr:signal peptidase I [Oscillospiraceae bacterium]